MDTPFVACEGLTKIYRNNRKRQVLAVNNLDLAIHKGETFGLVGESGCGKSTFGNLLVRLLEPTEGRILFEGRDITHVSHAREKQLRRSMQIIFQDPYASINPKKRIGWLVEEPLVIHGIGNPGNDRKRRVEEMLEAVGLDASFMKRWPSELSGGQRQRVAIANALILNPSFVVCDEAVSALDVSVQAQVLNLLKELQQSRGLTYLFISHNLNVVSYMADRIAVMYLGNLVEIGNTDQLATTPRHPYTQALFSASEDVDGPYHERIVLHGDIPSPSSPPSGCPFHPRCRMCAPRCTHDKPALAILSDGRYCACHAVEGT